MSEQEIHYNVALISTPNLSLFIIGHSRDQEYNNNHAEEEKVDQNHDSNANKEDPIPRPWVKKTHK